MTSLSEASSLLLPVIEEDLRRVIDRLPTGDAPLYSRMLRYHLGWVDQEGKPVSGGGGKRIRPLLCLLVSTGIAQDHQPARAAAASVELLHNFSLLHDDIQDESPLRRNRPTVWAIWGKAQAINAGDTLFALSHLAISVLPHPDTDGLRAAQMLQILDEACLELTRGQHLDLSFETRQQVSVEQYLDMISGKTAALLGASAQLGALAAGADARLQAAYREMGANLGMAFQVIDDILDIWGAPEVTGKIAGADIYQRKKSLPVVFALARDEKLRALYQSPEPFDKSQVDEAMAMLDRQRAREFAEDRARDYTERTFGALDRANPGGDSLPALRELIGQLLRRDR